jgi:hypothetical protein
MLNTPSLTAATLTISGNAASRRLAPVPEPSSILLLIAAIVGIAGHSLISKKK